MTHVDHFRREVAACPSLALDAIDDRRILERASAIIYRMGNKPLSLAVAAIAGDVIDKPATDKDSAP